MAIPSLTRDIDNAFTHTWYEIRPEAIDNILDANVVTAALRERGCFTPQTGGEYITRTIRYGTETTKTVIKGYTLGQGETELTTMAMWYWKYITAHIQRALQDDQKNQGKFRIKSFVETKTQAAKEALDAALETALTADPDTTGTTAEDVNLRKARDINSIYNMMPGGTAQGAAGAYGASASYKFGKIAFDNTWWRANYLTATAPMAVNLLAQMKNLYNTCTKGLESPNLIIMDQDLFETYEDFALDMTQIVKDNGSRLADLGYEVLKFKGKDVVWTSGITDNRALFLNTNYIEVVYDPTYWFEMTEWKYTQLQLERIAHIVSALNFIGTQPRRNGWLGTYAS